MKISRKFGLILFTIAILISLAACSGAPAAPTQTQAPTTPPEASPTIPPTNTPEPAQPTDTSVPSTASATEPSTEMTEDSERTPGQLNILSLNSYQDEWEDWHIFGLIANDTTDAVSDIEVEIEIFDEAENSLYTEVGYATLYNLAAGEISPFDLWVYEDLPDADHFVATIVGHNTSSVERAPVDFAKITRTVDKYNAINLTGEVTNNNETAILINGLAAAFFNDDGELVASDSVNVIKYHLEPGQSGPFRLTIYAPSDLAASLTDYQLYWDTTVAESADNYDLTFSEFYDYMDASGYFHLAGSITNNSTLDLSISMIASIYDVDGNVLDAASLSLPVYNIAPGETLPLDFDNWGPMSSTDDMYDKADEYFVTVDSYLTYESYFDLVDISTRDDSNTFSADEAKFIGYVVNDSGRDLTGATVLVALYEKGTDKLLATEYYWIFDDILNGAETTYEVTVDLPGGIDSTMVDYVIIAKGELP